MKSLRVLKRTGATAVDLVAELETEIARMRAEQATAKADAARFGRDWLVAASQGAADEAGRSRLEAKRVVMRCRVLIPELEQQLAAAKAEKQREGLSRHYAAIKAFVPKLIAAVEAAAQVQVQAILLRNAAVAELSETLVQANIPHVAFLGVLLPDLVSIWSAELRRSFEPPSAKRSSAAPTAPAAAKANGHAKPAPPPAATPRRAPRADPQPQTEDQRCVLFVRGNVDLEDGSGGTIIGDQRTLPADIAHRQVLLGNAEFVVRERELAPTEGN
jgi:hypothetical protein